MIVRSWIDHYSRNSGILGLGSLECDIMSLKSGSLKVCQNSSASMEMHAFLCMSRLTGDKGAHMRACLEDCRYLTTYSLHVRGLLTRVIASSSLT